MSKGMMMRYLRHTVALLLCSFAGAVCGQADWKPERNVEFIVGAAAAGANDRIARSLQNALQTNKLIPVSMSVVNKPGGGQTIAMAYLNTHTGNPHHLALASSSWMTTIAGARGAGTTHRDFTPIIRLFTEYQVFFVSSDSPLKTMADVRDRLKKDPGSVSFAYSVGVGNPLHISIVDVAATAGVDIKRVKAVVFDSGALSAAQVAGGHLDVGHSSPGSPMPMVQGGKLRYIGVAGPRRIPGPLADVPTLREQGMDVLTPISYVVMAPKGITPTQAAWWESMLTRMVQTDEIKKDIERNLWLVDLVGYKELPAVLDAQFDRYQKRLTEMGLVK